MKNIYTILFVLFSTHVISQSVYVPDNNFEQALIDLGVDDLLDDFVSLESVDTITNLILEYKGISSLEGIASFSNLLTLHCGGNFLTSLDVSSNIQLQMLDCYDNDITDLHLNENIYLEYLDCSINALTSLDLSDNLNLSIFGCHSNSITTLDLSSNLLLEQIDFANNNITSIDVSSAHSLTYINCSSNGLEAIDLTNTVYLERLNCSENELLELNVSNCPALKELRCGNNPFTELDLTNNSALKFFFCDFSEVVSLNLDENVALLLVHLTNGALESLSIKNGNNTAIVGAFEFYLINNPNLTCVTVDDPHYSEATWTQVDDILSYSSDCESLGSEEEELIEFDLYPNPTSEVLNLITELKNFDVIIYNSLGEVVIRDYQFSTKPIDVSNLTLGLYLVVITSEGQYYNQKLLIK
ncbi:MAG: T9SS type A sorting domain-containing protein [Crocinitomix sp.]|nr:T9SS type A sorting domain-containing protein [Crocinitomix sp.]